MKPSVGISGAGKIVTGKSLSPKTYLTSHLEALGAFAKADVVSIFDPNTLALKQVTNFQKIRNITTDWTEFLSAPCDYYVVASPTQFHVEQVASILKKTRPRGILLEKPISYSKDELKGFREIVAETKLVMNFQRHFDESLQSLARQIKEHRFGNPTSFSGILTKGFIHNGAHMMDLINSLFGGEYKLKPQNLKPADRDFTGTLAVDYQSGLKGSLHCLETADYSLFELTIYFENAKVALTNGCRRITAWTPEPSPVYAGINEMNQPEVAPETLGMAFVNVYNYLFHADASSNHEKMIGWIRQNNELLEIRDTL